MYVCLNFFIEVDQLIIVPKHRLQLKFFFFKLFRCPRPLNTGVRLIKVSCKGNKGNKLGDFSYCPLNRGCPLNTGSTVSTFDTPQYSTLLEKKVSLKVGSMYTFKLICPHS